MPLRPARLVWLRMAEVGVSEGLGEGEGAAVRAGLVVRMVDGEGVGSGGYGAGRQAASPMSNSPVKARRAGLKPLVR